MPKNIQLPDGRTLTVPDDASPDQLSSLKQQLSAKFGYSPERALADVPQIQANMPGTKNYPVVEGMKEAGALSQLAGLLQGFSENQASPATTGGVKTPGMGPSVLAPINKMVNALRDELDNWRISAKSFDAGPFKVSRVAEGAAEGPKVAVPPEKTTGQYDAAIKQAGGVPGGIQKGDPDLNLPNYAMFHDPKTGSSLMLPVDQVSRENVAAALAKSRNQYAAAVAKPGATQRQLVFTPEEFATHQRLTQSLEAATQMAQPQARLAGMIAAGKNAPMDFPKPWGLNDIGPNGEIPDALTEAMRQAGKPGQPFNPESSGAQANSAASILAQLMAKGRIR